MKIRLKILILLSSLVTLYSLYLWGIPAIIDIENNTNIQKIIKKELGIDVKLEEPKIKMGLIPSVWISANLFEITDGKYIPLKMINPKIKIKLVPLLFGRIHLKYFSCDNIRADFRIDKNSHFYIGNYLILKVSDSILSIEDSKMNLSEYDINIKDETQDKNIKVKGAYFNLKKYNSQKIINFSTNSNIKINNQNSIINLDVDFKLPLKKGFATNEIIFDGTVTNFNLNDISAYINKFTKGKITKTDGIINIQANTKNINSKIRRVKMQMVVEKFLVIFKDKESTVSFKDKLDTRVVCDFSKNNIKVNQFKMVSGSINLDIKGKINKIISENPFLDLSVSIFNSRTEDYISLLPNINFKNVDVNILALKKYKIFADMYGKIFIKGEYKKPKITGSLYFDNAFIIKPLNIPKATVKLEFLEDKVNLDAIVPVSYSENVKVNGNLELYNRKNVSLDISSTQNANLETTEFILNPLHEIFYFDLGPLPVMKLKGVGNIKLKTSGNRINPKLFGVFNFKNTTCIINDLSAVLTNGEGSLTFNDQNTYFNTKKASLNGKPVKISGKCSLLGDLDFDIFLNNQNFDSLYKILNDSKLLVEINKAIPSIKNPTGQINLFVKLKGKAKDINNFKIGQNILTSGNIKLLGNNLLLTNLNIPIKNLFGNIKFKNNDAEFELYSSMEKSRFHIEGKIRDRVLHSKVKLDDMFFTYYGIPVKIYSGTLEIHNDKLTLYKVNALLDSMPMLIDGYATNIFKKPNFNIYINAKPSQKFIDKYVNRNNLYPLKIKGDINFSSRINGTLESFSTKTEINLQDDSSIYYMGATIGDLNDPIRIFLDANISKNKDNHRILVNNFQYDKLISSQNNKEFISQQLNAKGQIDINKDVILLNNFKVKTQNPTDAKIFNILFKKSIIKQGLFTSSLYINGFINSPKLIGNLNFSGINMPIVDTIIKDISLNFKINDVDIQAKGEIFSNQINLITKMQNKLTPPYIFKDTDIYLGNLDVNEIVKSINKIDITAGTSKVTDQKNNIDVNNLIIKNAKIRADSIFVRNIFANSFSADFSLSEKMLFVMNNFRFNAAQGEIKGDFKYNLLNSKTELDLNISNVNANLIANSLFDLSNQIFGSLTGDVNLTCNGKSHKTCMDTLSGKSGFRVVNGNMPRLGSLEYLLRAANLVKSGITGLTINSIIDLVSPLRTGEFENINGNFTIKSGIAEDIQIFSRGKGLSIFLTGKYNFSTLIADMQVFGRVSKKISNILGPVGNTSLNTLFNTIPGINLDETNKTDFLYNLNKIPGFELNDKMYRIFSAEIYGDINGDNYVQTFKWVE